MQKITINNFRGINANDLPLKRVNVIIGENGSGKTSFLEAIFLFTVLRSSYIREEKENWLNYAFSSRGDIISSLSSLQDSSITIDGKTLNISNIGGKGLELNFGNNNLRILIKRSIVLSESYYAGTIYLPQYEIPEIHDIDSKYTPVYITLYFDSYGIPESIISLAKRRSKVEGLEILKDELTGQFKLYMDNLPVYVMGRGSLKKILIEASMNFADIILVDEIEDSLHPNTLNELAEKIAKSDSAFFLTTHSNEALKIIYDKVKDLNLIVMKGKKALSYSNQSDIEAIMEMDSALSWIKYA